MIRDIQRVQLRKKYSLGVFAAGYESRSTYCATEMSKSKVIFDTVLIFNYSNREEQRLASLKSSLSNCSNKIVEVSRVDEIAEKIKSVVDCRTFIDYSSMGRDVYASILCQLQTLGPTRIDIDLWYTHASYVGDFSPLKINDITAIEGSKYCADPTRKNAIFLGMGYDKISPVSVCELLEPDIIIPFVSKNSPVVGNDERTIEVNEEFISRLDHGPVLLPVNSIERSFQMLSELIAVYIQDHNCMLVPMGPKTHVMASVLLSQAREGVACLHVSGNREEDVDAVPTEDGCVSLTRITADPRIKF